MGYKSLADAAEITGDERYGDGRTMVWYQKPGMSRDFGMGWKFLQKHDLPTPDPRDLQKTHVFLGFVDERNLDKVFDMMQGMFWSPTGEARSLIRSKKLDHTSMMVGDVIQIGSTMYFVDRLGFEKLAGRGKRAADYSMTDMVYRYLEKRRIDVDDSYGGTIILDDGTTFVIEEHSNGAEMRVFDMMGDPIKKFRYRHTPDPVDVTKDIVDFLKRGRRASLRERVVRLAHEHLELRKDLLPLVKVVR